jgi:hypothetical protein
MIFLTLPPNTTTIISSYSITPTTSKSQLSPRHQYSTPDLRSATTALAHNANHYTPGHKNRIRIPKFKKKEKGNALFYLTPVDELHIHMVLLVRKEKAS